MRLYHMMRGLYFLQLIDRKCNRLWYWISNELPFVLLSSDNRSNKIWKFGDVISECFLHQSVLFLLLLHCYYYYWYYHYYYYYYYYYYSVLNVNAISVIYFNTARIKVLGCHLCASLDRYGWECLICWQNIT